MNLIEAILFPYYIVRFKLSYDVFPEEKFFWFPYYIVRFKLVFFIAPVIAPIAFPYYIVRFKPRKAHQSD